MATINLAWTPAGGPTSTGQEVQRKLNSASTWTTLATVSSSTSTYSDTTAANNTLYNYRIVNICSAGGPAPGPVTSADAIICPTITVTNPQTGAANTLVANIAATSGDVSFVSVQLFDATGVTPVSAVISLSGQGATSHTFTALSYSTSYTVKFTLSDGTISKVCSQTGAVGAAPACGAPTNLTATVA
jgi:hypothetical protein